MVIQAPWQGRTLTISIKPNCLTVSLQAGQESTVYSWDNAGRLWTAMRQGISYRRGLDGKVVAKWQTTGGGRGRCWLDRNQAGDLLEDARLLATALLADLRSASLVLSPAPSNFGFDVLTRAAGFDRNRYSADVQTYHDVYQPVGILPPDQYMAVVLQAALGCSFNTCTFCTFYRDRRFRIRPTDEFRTHAEAVLAYLGEGLSLRRTIFLGDANALVIPMPRLVPLFESTRSIFDVDRLGGIFAFLDGFSGEKKTSADYARLAELGLKRVYIGLESGHDPLLRFLKKPGQALDALHAVRAMKAGGVAVGVIILLGAGGKQFDKAHVSDTAFLLNRMNLDADDLIYFSELVENSPENNLEQVIPVNTAEVNLRQAPPPSPLLAYTRDAYAQNLAPLSSSERVAQGEEIESLLSFPNAKGVPHISRYDIREFVY